MKLPHAIATVFLLAAAGTYADVRDLVSEVTLRQIAEETSGEAAKKNLDTAR